MCKELSKCVYFMYKIIEVQVVGHSEQAGKFKNI